MTRGIQWGRLRPIVFMRDASVVGLIPNNSAAPTGSRAWTDDCGALRACSATCECDARRTGGDLSLRRCAAIRCPSVATDGAFEAFGYNRRRLRPNIVIGGVPGLAERQWEGGALRVGEVVIGIADLRQRCIMTTFDPDTQDQEVEVLMRIRREFGGSLALNCFVISGGTLRVGEPAVFVAPEGNA